MFNLAYPGHIAGRSPKPVWIDEASGNEPDNGFLKPCLPEWKQGFLFTPCRTETEVKLDNERQSTVRRNKDGIRRCHLAQNIKRRGEAEVLRRWGLPHRSRTKRAG